MGIYTLSPGAIWNVVAAANASTKAQLASADEAGRPRALANQHEADEAPTCRFCFCERDADAGGQLVAPCACVGSQVRAHESAYSSRSPSARRALSPALPRTRRMRHKRKLQAMRCGPSYQAASSERSVENTGRSPNGATGHRSV